MKTSGPNLLINQSHIFMYRKLPIL